MVILTYKKQIMKHYIFLLLILILSIPHTLKAQKKVLDCPREAVYPIEGKSITDIEDRTPGWKWIVFSDRSNNPTYKRPYKSSVKKRLQFLEWFYVIGYEGDYLHLVKDPNISDYGELSDSYEDYGWIKMQNLLLSATCWHTKSGSNQKVILVRPPNSNRQPIFSKHPSYSERITYKGHLYHTLFLYKKTSTAVLVGNIPKRIRSYQSAEAIFGWIPIEQTTIWNIAIEPNCKTEAVEEHLHKNTTTQVFATKEDALRYQQGAKNIKPVWEDIPSPNRWPGELPRFIVLDTLDDVLKIGIHTSTLTGNHTPSSPFFKHIPLYTIAYTSITVKGFTNPIFKPCLLLDRRELGSLLYRLRGISEMMHSYPLHEAMYNSWYDVIRTHIGTTLSKEDFEKMTFEEINEKVFGVRETHLSIKGKKVSDINTKNINYISINQFWSAVERKNDDLYAIFTRNNYQYGFQFSGTNHYWIYTDFLP